jgi:hypothetical protein
MTRVDCMAMFKLLLFIGKLSCLSEQKQEKYQLLDIVEIESYAKQVTIDVLNFSSTMKKLMIIE